MLIGLPQSTDQFPRFISIIINENLQRTQLICTVPEGRRLFLLEANLPAVLRSLLLEDPSETMAVARYRRRIADDPPWTPPELVRLSDRPMVILRFTLLLSNSDCCTHIQSEFELASSRTFCLPSLSCLSEKVPV